MVYQKVISSIRRNWWHRFQPNIRRCIQESSKINKYTQNLQKQGFWEIVISSDLERATAVKSDAILPWEWHRQQRIHTIQATQFKHRSKQSTRTDRSSSTERAKSISSISRLRVSWATRNHCGQEVWGKWDLRLTWERKMLFRRCSPRKV